MKVFTIVKAAILAFLCYIVVSVCVYPFIRIGQKTSSADEIEVNSLEEIKKNQPSNESVTINSKMDSALALRCELIDKAKDTLLVSQYSIVDDDSGMIFIGKLLDAAQRGVKVKLLVNGLSNKMTPFSRIPFAIFHSEPNIQVKMIGGINLIEPWTMNNVMHDKLIIADDKYFLSSGRNIGMRFMVKSDEYKNVEDLEILVKKEGTLEDHALIKQGMKYFTQLWNSPQAINKDKQPSFLTKKAVSELPDNISDARKRRKKLLSKNVLENLEFNKFNAGYLVHNNPIEVIKSPVVFKQLTTLMNHSEKSVTLASPYVVLTKKMQTFIKLPSGIKKEVLTNSGGNSPNIFAFSDYQRHKEELLKTYDIWEYQGAPSLHQKALLIDDQIGIVGSFNFDSRSAYLSNENMLIINGEAFQNQLAQVLDDYKKESLEAADKKAYKTKSNHVKELDISTSKAIIQKVFGLLTQPFRHLL